MKTNASMLTAKLPITLAISPAAITLLASRADVARVQALPSGIQDVVKLKQAGLLDEVILVQNRITGVNCNLKEDQNIYLKKHGVWQTVSQTREGGHAAVTPAVNATPASPPAAPPVPTPAPAVAVPKPPLPQPAWLASNLKWRFMEHGFKCRVTVCVGNQQWR